MEKHKLTEHEIVRLENIKLKRELLQRQSRDIDIMIKMLGREIGERLGVAVEDYKVEGDELVKVGKPVPMKEAAGE